VLRNGDRLGPYLIVGALGTGGMGEVYRAQDVRLGRTVAVKVLSHSADQREDIRQRFEREARVISSLNHPNICALYDVGKHDHLNYLVMECLEGETLEARLARGPLPLEDSLKYATQIANALHRAHRSGVVHRDLKPSNIMLTRDGVKLLDFGLAKLQSKTFSTDETVVPPLTGEHTVLGTLPYMAPEQVEGRQADMRSDVFAFGAVLFEMLTGRRAFAGSTPASVIAAIVNGAPTFDGLAFEPPPGIVHLIKACLMKNPEERWQSARDLTLHMEFLSKSHPALAHDRKRGRPVIWAYLAAVLVGAILASVPWFLPHRGDVLPLAVVAFPDPRWHLLRWQRLRV